MTSTTNPTLHKGIVKQIVSGDCIVIRGQPRGGPPPERTICLSNIEAPRLARRPNAANTNEVKDSPCAWEAREFLRKKLIGKEVCFSVEYKQPTNNREYGFVWLGKDNTGENVAESLVEQGLAGVRKGNAKNDSEAQVRLTALEDSAKAAQRGKWAPDADKTVRDITWNIEKEKMRNFVESKRSKPVKAVIEHVRDGCTIRAFLLPSFEYVTVMLTGIKTPMFKQEGDKQIPEEFAEEAKYFVESRLLQRDVEIILEGLSGMNYLGTVLHPNGNISELLLREGFAKCIDWSMGCVTQEIDKMRKAEKLAKERHVRLWKDYKPPSNMHSPVQDGSSKNFSAKVIEIANADALIVKMDNGTERKIFLASIRPPKLPNDNDKASPDKKKIKPLYDIPYMYEAREFLRKKLIGKKVKVSVDYIQPASNQFPEKTCCTVHIGDINVAEALVSKGFATVVRYRQDDNQRAVCYDLLLTAENRAEKKSVGLHSKKEYVPVRVQDLSGNVNASRQFFSSLQRAGRNDALVEFVASGSRLRVYMPRNTCIATILLAGIDCPKASRPNAPAEPFGEDALALIKEKVMQYDVQVAVESMDKGGNFIGYVYAFDGTNLSELLLKNGLAKLHFSAERGPHAAALSAAQSAAQSEKLKIWQDYEPEAENPVEKLDNDTVEERSEENAKETKEYEKVIVTEVTDEFTFFAQNSDKGPALDKLMGELRADLAANPPVPGAFQAKKGDLCVAKFSEDQAWYRAKVLNVDAQKVAEVLFIDFGNTEKEDVSKLAPLAASYRDLPAVAKQYTLACISFPSDDEETKLDACYELRRLANGCECRLNVEYHATPEMDAVQLMSSSPQEDIGLQLIANGYVVVDKTKKRDRKVREMFTKYTAEQEKAKAKRLNIWMYGDVTADEATEFGYSR